MKFCVMLLACVAISFFSFSQAIPANPNLTDSNGLRQGKWTLLFDANWNSVTDTSKAVYHRLIVYENDKPSGLVRDYYPSGKVQWEGMLIEDRPKEINDGTASWYREDGTRELVKVFENGKLIKEQSFNKDGSPIVGMTWSMLLNKAFQVHAKGYYDSTEFFLKAGFVQAEKEFGKEHPNYASALNNLGFIYSFRLNYTKAESAYLEALRIREKVLGKDHPKYVESLSSLGVLYVNQLRYAEALVKLKEAVEITGKTGNIKNSNYADYINNLAMCYQETGDYLNAEKLFKKAAFVAERNSGKKSNSYTLAIGNLGSFYYTQGNYEKSIALFSESMAIREQINGKNTVEYAVGLNNLATFYKAKGDFEKSIAMYKEAVSINERIFGKTHPDYLSCLNNLANAYCYFGFIARGEELFEESVLLNGQLSKDSYDYALSMNNLAYVYVRQGKNLQKAEQLYLESLDIFRKNSSKDNRQYSTCLTNLATAYFQQKKYEKAEVIMLEVVENQLDLVANYFPALSEKEKKAFYKTTQKSFGYLNSFSLKRRFENPVTASAIYNTQLANKALLFNANNKIRERILTSGDTVLVKLYNTWKTMKEYAVKAYQMTEKQLEKSNIIMSKLEEEVNEIEKDISNRSQSFARNNDNKRYTWQDVKNNLRSGEGAVEIVRVLKYGSYESMIDSSNVSLGTYKIFDLTDSVSYVALIVTPNSRYPEVLTLDNGDELEGIYLKAYKNHIRFKSDDTISYNKFWGPIAAVLKRNKVKRVFVSPDGIFNALNLNALYNPSSKKYSQDELDIHLVTNTKDLIKPKSRGKKSKGLEAYLFGYPDYNPGDSLVILPDSSRSMTAGLAGNSIQRFFENGTITRLPGTRTEIKAIYSLLDSHHVKTIEFTEAQATEEHIKKISNPQILHIATHGFFLRDIDSSPGQSFAGFDTKKIEENPLLRSGLLMTGSQRAINGQRDLNAEDGILTAYEAMNLNLDQTDLVVLSACETGLGEIINGEGVYGLQRAFQTAGAKSILMSLWKVDDTATQELMTSFYKNWLKSGDKREAFKNAQEIVRKKYPHPYYWGAFVLVGE